MIKPHRIYLIASVLIPMTCILLIYAAAHAAAGDAIVGIWDDEDKEARIEIFKCGPKYCGKIVWLQDPFYTADEDGARVGRPRADDNNPDPNLRDRLILGLRIMSDFAYEGNHTWADGNLYDPKTGRTYSGKMTLVSGDRLALRGYVIFSLFGRTSTWTRVRP